MQSLEPKLIISRSFLQERKEEIPILYALKVRGGGSSTDLRQEFAQPQRPQFSR